MANTLVQHITIPLMLDGVTATIAINVNNPLWNPNPLLLNNGMGQAPPDPVSVVNDDTAHIANLTLAGHIVTVTFQKVPFGLFNIHLMLLYSGT